MRVRKKKLSCDSTGIYVILMSYESNSQHITMISVLFIYFICLWRTLIPNALFVVDAGVFFSNFPIVALFAIEKFVNNKKEHTTTTK